MFTPELPKPRIEPLSEDHDSQLAGALAVWKKRLGFVPNSILTMQRRPKLVQALTALSQAVRGPESDSQVDAGLLSLMSQLCSRAAGCRYCMAHTAHSAVNRVPDQKLDALWEYASSPLYTEAERAALDYALASGSVPNGVADELFARLRRYWNDDQIVDMTALVALFGFLNRWNDSLATPLEDEPMETASIALAHQGWQAGKRARR